ncbi:MAG: carbohydrate ABC transporter permease [Actinobacteria bacterium]|nr:carbohydrate ABC transporter permease [Actinomycetota bacterium]MBM3712161.1 carbohydrate ABC transporter permease [Actinomycetota bacterium]
MNKTDASLQLKMPVAQYSISNRMNRFWAIIIYTTLIAWTIFSIGALLWIIFTSFKTNKELYAGVWALPKGLHFDNYVKAWSVVNLGRFFLNSIIVTTLAIFALTFLCTPAAYVLSRFNFKGRGFINNLIIGGMGVPYQLLLIPLYKIFIDIKLADNLFGLTLVYVVLSLPFTIYLLSGFIRSLPSELEQAALIDGCSEYGVFWKVIFPLAQPGIMAAAIFNFIFLWNEYMLALVFLPSSQNKTISLGLYSIQSAMQYTADWTGLFAAVVIVMMPTVIIYFILSEKVMTGITLGAVKG